MGKNNIQGQQVSNVLVCGNTKLLEENTINQISRYYNLLIAGETSIDIKESRKIHFFAEKPGTEKFGKLCYSFSPDVIWFFSGYADGGEGFDDEVKMIEALFKESNTSDVGKVIIVSSIDSLDFDGDDNTRLTRFSSERNMRCYQNEELANYLAQKYDTKLVILHAPYIAKELNDDNYLGTLFNSIKYDKLVNIPFNVNQNVDFINMKNLVELLVAVSEENVDKAGDYTIYSGFWHDYGQLEQKVKEIAPKFEFKYDNYVRYIEDDFYEKEAKKIRKTYGFTVTDDVFSDITNLYLAYIENMKIKSTFIQNIELFVKRKTGGLLKYIELILFFMLIEFLIRITGNSVFFKYVDFRLFYVVIIGITHGMKMGIIAGILECVSLVWGYRSQDVTGTMLFYNFDYWLPFVIYLMSGTVVGYIKNTNEQKISFTNDENNVLKDKYLFLNSVYQQVIVNKGEYKRQILGYQDSFGKIFEAVEQLNASVISDVFMNGVETLERILENKSIAIYTLDEYQNYARLAACSREINKRLVRSLVVSEYQPVFDTISKGETWKNVEFLDNAPMYAYGICRDGKVQIMIAVYEVEANQLGLYYMNLFSILCSLIRVSFIRAFDYQIAIEDEKYIPGTTVLKPEYFEEVLKIQEKMEEIEMASYILLKLESKDAHFINRTVTRLIRQNDVLGALQDGFYYLMLTQVSDQNLSIVGRRLEENGVKFEVVGE